MPQTTQIQPANRYTKSDALAAKITELYAYITAANHRFLELVAEFDEKGYWQLCGVHSCAHWLNWQCGIGMNAAREKVRVARALKELPKISKAFAARRDFLLEGAGDHPRRNCEDGRLPADVRAPRNGASRRETHRRFQARESPAGRNQRMKTATSKPAGTKTVASS